MVAAGAAAALHKPDNEAASTAYTTTNCTAAPKLAADTTTDTLLGVNASSPGQLTSATAEFGHLPIIRVYYTGMPDPNAWTTGAPAINKSAVVLSFRVLPSTILSGVDDAALAHFFDTAPTGHPIYYSYYHEPEPFIEAGTFTLAQYKAAWTHIVDIADAAHNPYLRSTLILMSWDLDPQSGIDWKDYLPSGNVISTLGWDAYPAGTVHNEDPQDTPPADFMGPEVAASKSVGLPFGFAEFALGTQTGRPAWLAAVASYLQSSGALFGTLFNSTGFPWMELNDSPSISAWRSAVEASNLGTLPNPGSSPSPPASSSPTPTPTSTQPTATPTPTPSSSAPATTGPTITEPSVSPAAFTPTGANHVRIMFKLGQPATVTICVLSPQGGVLRELDPPDQPAGWSSTWYFGHDEAGNLLPSGTYPVLIVASDSEGVSTARTSLTITGDLG
jgi:beta-mannanase